MVDIVVIQRNVIEHIFLIFIHPIEAVLYDHSHFISKSGIVGQNVGNRRGQDMAVAVLMLQALAVQRGAAGGGAESESPSARIPECPE